MTSSVVSLQFPKEFNSLIGIGIQIKLSYCTEFVEFSDLYAWDFVALSSCRTKFTVNLIGGILVSRLFRVVARSNIIRI